MAHRNEFIPRKDRDFDIWGENLCELAVERTGGPEPGWDHVPPQAVAKLTGTFAVWHAAYAVTLEPHTFIDTGTKNRARAAMDTEGRSFVNEYIRNSSEVSEADKARAGVFARAKRHRIEPPRSVPVLEPSAGTPGQIRVFYLDAVKGGRGLPKDVLGIEVLWAVLDHEPANTSELVHSSFGTRCPLILSFDEADRGKKIYMTGRWQIERGGKKGLTGEIASCFIP
jgi:hypothetical protein